MLLKFLKNKLLVVSVFIIVNTDAYAGLPTKIEGVDVDTNDLMSTFKSLFASFVDIASWIAGVGIVLHGAFVIWGGLADSRKKGDSSLFWGALRDAAIAIVVVFLLIIILQSITS